MPDPVDTLELALRLRRHAQATDMPEYAALMRRAADDLEDFARIAISDARPRERLAG